MNPAIRTIIISFTLITATVATSTAFADSRGHATRTSVMTMGKLLKATAGVIPSPDKMSSVCDDPALALMGVVEHRKIRSKLRARALDALTHYADDDRVYEFLVEKLEVLDADDTWFAPIVMSFGQAYGEQSVELISALLDHRDTDVRKLAVRALGLFGGQEGYDLLVLLKSDDHAVELHPEINNFIF